MGTEPNVGEGRGFGTTRIGKYELGGSELKPTSRLKSL